MTVRLALRNHQAVHPVDTRLLRRIASFLLESVFQVRAGELSVHLLGPAAMARLNQAHLGHTGATDVITFDYADRPEPGTCRGEIFICVAEAVRQSRTFRTAWTSELARYLAHGLLHLHGHDDLTPGPRRRMKREENRLVRRLARRFPLARLARTRS